MTRSTVFSLRLGNDHLGPFRAIRIPWVQHRLELGIAGLVLFWMIAAAHYARVADDRPVEATARTN